MSVRSPLRYLATVLALAACAPADRTEQEVRARFAAFEAALRTVDADALCDLLTRESLPALEQMHPATTATEQTLVVDAVCRRDPTRYDIAVRDGDAAPHGVFVMLRENGAWRVDLVESAVATHGTEKGPVSIEPAGLTPRQIDGIRANHAAAQK